MSARPLPVSTPAEQGVDARGVQAFLDVVEAAPDIEPHSLMILRHGRLVASGWWAPYAADRLHLLYSLSKSFTSTAAGVALAEGLIDLDAPVISYGPEFAPEITDPRSRALLVRHLASMASGHLAETNVRAFGIDRAEPVRGFLLIPPDRDPGTVFAYNPPATYTLAANVQRRSGQSLTEYLRPRILDPLGIGEVAWLQHPRGRDLGVSGLHATTAALARLGLCTFGTASGRAGACCPPPGSPRRRARTSPPPTARPRAPGPTGSRATASSSGRRGTDTAATGRTASSASSCRGTTP